VTDSLFKWSDGVPIALDWWSLHPTQGSMVSVSKFKVTGNYTGRFVKGTKIRLVQSGSTKFFYVVSAAYDAGNTTVTITGGSDYALSSNPPTTITDLYYSYAATPPGFPAWFDYFATSTITGWSNPTGGLRFKMVGDQVFVDYYLTGTSNATATSFSLPVPHAEGWHTRMGIIAQNNGTQIQGFMQMQQWSSLVAFYTTIGWGGWTASGTKTVAGHFSYPAGN